MSIINITNDWLASRQAPYIINGPAILQTEVAVPTAAFVLSGTTASLDGNGHHVTFGNSTPIIVPNGGFEDGLDGWDCRLAPTAISAPVRYAMWGARMLSLPDCRTPQIIVSSLVAIPQAGREYTATITPKGYNVIVTLIVIDSITGAELVRWHSKDPQRGMSAVATWVHKTTNPVRLRVECLPIDAAKVAAVDLDYAAVLPSQDFGVIATTASWYLPAHLNTPATAAAMKTFKNGTIANLTIIQGSGRGFNSDAIYGRGSIGLTVSNCRTFVNGMNSQSVELQSAVGPTVKDSLHEADIDNISDRMGVFAAIRADKPSGNITITGNTIKNFPQCGIVVGANTGGSVVIENNTINNRSRFTDSYGVVVSGLTDFSISNNRIVGDGRGIMLDSWNAASMQNGTISGNYVDIYEYPNLEYTFDALEASAFRLRTFDGVFHNIAITDNTFIARTDEHGTSQPMGARIGIRNADGLPDAITFERNICRGITNTANSLFRAIGFAASAIHAGTGLQVKDCTFESNDVSLCMGDSASYNSVNEDVDFINCLITKVDTQFARPHTSILVGDQQTAINNIRIVNPTYSNGAIPGVTFAGKLFPKDVEVTEETEEQVVTVVKKTVSKKYVQATANPKVITVTDVGS